MSIRSLERQIARLKQKLRDSHGPDPQDELTAEEYREVEAELDELERAFDRAMDSFDD